MTNRDQTRRRKVNEAGFSLIEIMAVVVIIGMLATGVTIYVAGRMEKSRRELTKSDIQELKGAIEMFKMDTNEYPEKLEHLINRPSDVSEQEWAGPYLSSSEVPQDKWGNEYKYEVSGSSFTIISYGADGSPGGDGDDADITVESGRR